MKFELALRWNANSALRPVYRGEASWAPRFNCMHSGKMSFSMLTTNCRVPLSNQENECNRTGEPEWPPTFPLR